MAEVIRMPRMSDTMTEGVIVAWHKKVGDSVKSGDVLAEVETDKATMELEAYVSGVLLHIGIEEGSAVPVESIIAIIGKAGEDIKGLLSESSAPSPAPAVEEKKEEVQENKEVAPAAQPAQEEKANAPESQQENNSSIGRILASPLAKRLAEEKGIDIGSVSGSGDAGRVVKKDVESYTPQAKSSATSSKSAPNLAGEYFDTPVTQMRKTIARRLAESKFTAPHFYLSMDINMDKSMDFRKQINEATGQKASFNDIIIKAAAVALMKHPKVNSSWLGDKIRTYNYVNIGVAIAVDEGLVVPVLRNAHSKGIIEISNEVKDYAEKAKSKKLQPNDYEGNTFSISNLGMFGIDNFTAIINPPDACILAVGAIRNVAQFNEKTETVSNANIMNVTLSCDHRVVDGAMGAQFLQTLKGFLENPITMLV